VRLALGDVLGHEEVQQRVQALVERVELAVARDVLGDARIVAGQRAQLGDVVRVGQEPHVEGEVGVAHLAVLEAERRERDRQRLRRARQHLAADAPPQRRGAHARRVDDEVGPVAQRRQRGALGGDARRHLPGRGERMAPARLLVARQQRLVVGVEEEDAVAEPGPLELLEHLEQRVEELAAAHVADHRGPLDLRARMAEQLVRPRIISGGRLSTQK
jgi:hypothetical protein